MEATFAIIVTDEIQNPVREAGIILSIGQEGWTNMDGYVAFQVPTETAFQFSVHKQGYDTTAAPVVTITQNTDFRYIARRLAPLVRPLHIEDLRFIDDAGQEYIYKGATNFLLFQRFLEGEDIEPLLYPGAEVYRTTLVMKYIPNLIGFRDLRPENYPHYWTGLDDFAEYLLVRGKRLRIGVLTGYRFFAGACRS